jgi:hypothetical protein
VLSNSSEEGKFIQKFGVIIWQGITKKTYKVEDRRDIDCEVGRLKELTQDRVQLRPLALDVLNLLVMLPER